MNYKQLSLEMKVKIDTLLENKMSMREVGRRLNISHSTISRYKNRKYRRRKINIFEKYEEFLKYLYSNYDWKTKSIEVCVVKFKRRYPDKPCVSVQQVYNWIDEGKIKIKRDQTCYKKRKTKRKKSGMMSHVVWNMENKTILPISLRPKYIEERKEKGHLEIDSIVGRRNEYGSIISIVDRCTRKVWLIKASYKQEYYIDKLIYEYLVENEIEVKSITTDNGLEFKALGICAKKLGVKLYKCDPYCSFQRGTNERMNAIVRRFIPKGTPMKFVPQSYLDDISFKINRMPRKIFDFKSAYEVEIEKR